MRCFHSSPLLKERDKNPNTQPLPTGFLSYQEDIHISYKSQGFQCLHYSFPQAFYQASIHTWLSAPSWRHFLVLLIYLLGVGGAFKCSFGWPLGFHDAALARPHSVLFHSSPSEAGALKQSGRSRQASSRPHTVNRGRLSVGPSILAHSRSPLDSPGASSNAVVLLPGLIPYSTHTTGSHCYFLSVTRHLLSLGSNLSPLLLLLSWYQTFTVSRPSSFQLYF